MAKQFERETSPLCAGCSSILNGLNGVIRSDIWLCWYLKGLMSEEFKAQIRRLLNKILASPMFAVKTTSAGDRPNKFLRFVVEEYLAGRRPSHFDVAWEAFGWADYAKDHDDPRVRSTAHTVR